ncbi:MAG: hypothetical protein AAGL89_04900 [Pseudomonadota bacterium]
MDRDDQIMDYVQGRMDRRDRAAFEARLDDDAELAAELSVLTSLRDVHGDEIPDGSGPLWSRIEASIAAEPRSANDNRAPRLSVLKVAGIAVASVLAWNYAVAPLLQPSTPAVFQTASDEAAGPVLQVVFADSATLGDIAALLREVDALIIEGPGATGVFRLSLAAGADVLAVRDALQDRGDLIVMVTIQ